MHSEEATLSVRRRLERRSKLRPSTYTNAYRHLRLCRGRAYSSHYRQQAQPIERFARPDVQQVEYCWHDVDVPDLFANGEPRLYSWTLDDQRHVQRRVI